MDFELDFEMLRRDLLDYFGTAMTSGFGIAVMDVVKIERASYEELINYAYKCNFDLSKYVFKVLKK